jgi:RNA polymerase sigma factor (sigma-70 family)
MDWPGAEELTIEHDPRISETVRRERSRLLAFIRRRIADANEAEDILQESFCELVEAFRIVQPVEHIGPWLFRVIRNRIIDFYRAKRHEVSMNEPVAGEDDSDSVELQDLLPSRDAGPEAAFARSVLLEELQLALDELPAEQRAVFIANEFEGRSFRELAEESGVSINTLLSRKRYAVLSLRRRLHGIYDEFTERK